MDGGGFQGIPAIWIPAIPAGMTYLSLRLKNLANRMPEHGIAVTSSPTMFHRAVSLFPKPWGAFPNHS